MGRPAASVSAAAGRVSVWRRDSGARHGFTVVKRIPATCMVVVRGLRPLSVRCERRATAHHFMELNQLCLPGLLETLINKGIVCEHNNVVREKEIGYYQIEYRQMKVGRGKGYQGKEL